MYYWQLPASLSCRTTTGNAMLTILGY